MRFATISTSSGPACAVQLADLRFLPVAAACAASGVTDTALTDGSLQALIEGGDTALSILRGILARANAGDDALATLAVMDPTLLAPLPRPQKNVFCVGRNYAEHIAEGARAQNTTVAVTEVPVYFTKPCTAVIGHGAVVPIFVQPQKSPIWPLLRSCARLVPRGQGGARPAHGRSERGGLSGRPGAGLTALSGKRAGREDAAQHCLVGLAC